MGFKLLVEKRDGKHDVFTDVVEIKFNKRGTKVTIVYLDIDLDVCYYCYRTEEVKLMQELR